MNGDDIKITKRILSDGMFINTMRYICKTDLTGQQKDREELLEASSIPDGLL